MGFEEVFAEVDCFCIVGAGDSSDDGEVEGGEACVEESFEDFFSVAVSPVGFCDEGSDFASVSVVFDVPVAGESDDICGCF